MNLSAALPASTLSISGTKPVVDPTGHCTEANKMATYKGLKEWAGMLCTQTIKAHDGPIWAMAFSASGLFLATCGRDGKVTHMLY